MNELDANQMLLDVVNIRSELDPSLRPLKDALEAKRIKLASSSNANDANSTAMSEGYRQMSMNATADVILSLTGKLRYLNPNRSISVNAIAKTGVNRQDAERVAKLIQLRRNIVDGKLIFASLT